MKIPKTFHKFLLKRIPMLPALRANSHSNSFLQINQLNLHLAFSMLFWMLQLYLPSAS
ncbi:MAG: hypothetical protein N2117_00320 [Anaerolineales bacterium]|nr:hypothetical protein [Anaerolineales bacterium]